jgi:hypothetical protein
MCFVCNKERCGVLLSGVGSAYSERMICYNINIFALIFKMEELLEPSHENNNFAVN